MSMWLPSRALSSATCAASQTTSSIGFMVVSSPHCESVDATLSSWVARFTPNITSENDATLSQACPRFSLERRYGWLNAAQKNRAYGRRDAEDVSLVRP